MESDHWELLPAVVVHILGGLWRSEYVSKEKREYSVRETSSYRDVHKLKVERILG